MRSYHALPKANYLLTNCSVTKKIPQFGQRLIFGLAYQARGFGLTGAIWQPFSRGQLRRNFSDIKSRIQAERAKRLQILEEVMPLSTAESRYLFWTGVLADRHPENQEYRNHCAHWRGKNDNHGAISVLLWCAGRTRRGAPRQHDHGLYGRGAWKGDYHPLGLHHLQVGGLSSKPDRHSRAYRLQCWSG